MKRALILAGGTTTAWHIAETIKRYYKDELYLVICDTNPEHLVHTSVLADKFIQVPPIKTPNYYEKMLDIFCSEGIDLVIPLIDNDIMLFTSDNTDLRQMGLTSSAPDKETVLSLSNKRNMEKTLRSIGIRTPRIISDLSEIAPEVEYYIKNMVGFGSRDVHKVKGKDIIGLSDQQFVQEMCNNPEITVDVVNDSKRIYTICRERVETKLGVSTKCKVFYSDEIQEIIEKVSNYIALPAICCVQFMADSRGHWSLIDFNLRSGGGTAISAAVGFEAVRAAIAIWIGKNINCPDYLKKVDNARYVVRTYSEIVTK